MSYSEFYSLNPLQQAAVREACKKAKAASGQHEAKCHHETAYAYQNGGGIAWGMNGGAFGFCIARGVFPIDHSEIA